MLECVNIVPCLRKRSTSFATFYLSLNDEENLENWNSRVCQLFVQAASDRRLQMHGINQARLVVIATDQMKTLGGDLAALRTTVNFNKKM